MSGVLTTFCLWQSSLHFLHPLPSNSQVCGSNRRNRPRTRHGKVSEMTLIHILTSSFYFKPLLATSGHTGRFRIILPETVAEFERWSSNVGKTFRLSQFPKTPRRNPGGPALPPTSPAYEAERARINIPSATSVPTKAGSGRMKTSRTPHRNCVLKHRDP